MSGFDWRYDGQEDDRRLQDAVTERFFSLPPRFAQHCPFFSVASDRPCEQADSVP